MSFVSRICDLIMLNDIKSYFLFSRFIIHNDKSNPQLTSMEIFSRELLKFKPSLLILGGLQMMDNFPFEPGKNFLQF